MTYPPPHDLDAERVVLSAVLCGEVTATELRLRPSCFLAPLYRGAWAAALSLEHLRRDVAGTWLADVMGGSDGNLTWITRVLADGVLEQCRREHGPGAEELPDSTWFHGARERKLICQLLEIRGLMHTARAARGATERLRELDRHRQLILAMQRLDAQLRTGVTPSSRLVAWTVRRLETMKGGVT